jgi:hypothetical protein
MFFLFEKILEAFLTQRKQRKNHAKDARSFGDFQNVIYFVVFQGRYICIQIVGKFSLRENFRGIF